MRLSVWWTVICCLCYGLYVGVVNTSLYRRPCRTTYFFGREELKPHRPDDRTRYPELRRCFELHRPPFTQRAFHGVSSQTSSTQNPTSLAAENTSHTDDVTLQQNWGLAIGLFFIAFVLGVPLLLLMLTLCEAIAIQNLLDGTERIIRPRRRVSNIIRRRVG